MQNDTSIASQLVGRIMSVADCHKALEMMKYCFDCRLDVNVQTILQASFVKDVAIIVSETYAMLEKYYHDQWRNHISEYSKSYKATCERFRHSVHIPMLERNASDYYNNEILLENFLNKETSFLIIEAKNVSTIIWSDLYYSHLYAYTNEYTVASLQQDFNIIYGNLQEIINWNCKLSNKLDLSCAFKPIPKEEHFIAIAERVMPCKTFFNNKKIKPSNILKLLTCKIEINSALIFLESGSLSELLDQSDWIYFVTKWLAIKYDEVFDCLYRMKTYDDQDKNFLLTVLSGNKYKSVCPLDSNVRKMAQQLRNMCHYVKFNKIIDEHSTHHLGQSTYDFDKVVFTIMGNQQGYKGMKSLFNKMLCDLKVIDKFIDEVLCSV